MSGDANDIINPAYDMPTRTASYTTVAGTVTAWQESTANSVWVMCTTTAFVFVGSAGVADLTDAVPVAANAPVIIAVPPSLTTWFVSAVRIGAVSGDVYAKPLMN